MTILLPNLRTLRPMPAHLSFTAITRCVVLSRSVSIRVVAKQFPMTYSVVAGGSIRLGYHFCLAGFRPMDVPKLYC